MNRDFKTRHELLNHVEARVLPNIDVYTRMFMDIGDVFQSGPIGLYHPHTGECIVDFGRPGHTVDHRTGRMTEITSYEDYYRANGAIYNHKGEMTLSHRNLRKVELVDNRPVRALARDAAIALVADVLYEHFDHSSIAGDLPSIGETLHMDLIEESSKKKSKYLNVRWAILEDLERDLGQYSWHGMWMHKAQGLAVIDIQVDIRIKKYYEDIFDEQDNNQQNESICSIFRVQHHGYRFSRTH